MGVDPQTGCHAPKKACRHQDLEDASQAANAGEKPARSAEQAVPKCAECEEDALHSHCFRFENIELGGPISAAGRSITVSRGKVKQFLEKFSAVSYQPSARGFPLPRGRGRGMRVTLRVAAGVAA